MRFLIFFVVVLCAGCSSAPPDPRAYPGSRDDMTLEQLTARLGMTLPSCDMEGLRYFATMPFSGFLMTFESTPDCVDQFIIAAGSSRSSNSKMLGRILSINHDLTEEFGWEIKQDQEYDLYSGQPAPDVSVTLVVDTLASPERVYFRAAIY